MKHKIILYNPKAVFWTMPLALMAVGSALNREKYEVVIIDGRFESQQTVLDQLIDAACLGISVLTGAPLYDALEVSRAAREIHPDLPIIWGGWHPSLFAEMCSEENAVTAVVTGQGEETFSEVLDRLVEGDSLDGVLGCVFSRDDQVVANFPRPTADINDFPRHDYSLIDVEKYFRRKGNRQIDYVSSQGCRFRCNFCADPAVFKRSWYGYSPDRMVSEITKLWKKYDFADLSLQDETYFTHQKRVAAIAEGFLQEQLRFTWTGTMRADQGRRLDDEVLALCAKSGLRRVMIGLEAGSQDTINLIQKDIDIADMWATAEKLVHHKIGAIINVIVGFPSEPAESVTETLRVAAELRAMSSNFELALFYFKPYPGNPIAERLQAEGYQFPATLDEWSRFDYIGSSNDWLTEEQRQEVEHFKFYQRFAYSSNGSFLRRPIQWFSRWRVERRFYAIPFERAVIEKLKPTRALS